jgi:hypothetical protein
LPRKSLTEGDSPRITLRMNHEIENILSDIDKNERSAFIREAIVHYASSSTYRRKSISISPSTDNLSLLTKEKVEPSSPVRVLHKPAWQR